MILQVTERSYVVFDLDDTLYPEIDYVRSGYRHISNLLEPMIGVRLADLMMERHQAGEEVLGWLCETYSLPASHGIEHLLHEYRTHRPALSLPEGSHHLIQSLSALDVPIGLVTDGRSVSQRNKLAALGIDMRFDHVVISEEIGSGKPSRRNFEIFERRHPGRLFTMIGDNPVKDFAVPHELGWVTICLRATADNVHAQDLDVERPPDYVVDSLADIKVRKVKV